MKVTFSHFWSLPVTSGYFRLLPVLIFDRASRSGAVLRMTIQVSPSYLVCSCAARWRLYSINKIELDLFWYFVMPCQPQKARLATIKCKFKLVCARTPCTRPARLTFGRPANCQFQASSNLITSLGSKLHLFFAGLTV